jgi:serine/threonine-protein kinase HipA
MQLKASVDLRGGKVVAPVHGEPGHFIVKFQDPQFREVPQVEHAIMSWARASGLRVADTRLVDPGDIDELPLLGRYEGEPALLVRRFDRAEGRRVHAEEFNQVFGLRVEERYQRRGWKHHLAMLNQVCPEDVAEYLRRLLFMILSGHSDAHHKNWGLYYPEGVPRLSPAYDLLCVRAWAGEPGAPDDRLPFALGSHDKRWERLEWDGFLRLPGEAKVHTFVDGARRVGPADLGDWAAEELRRQAARVDVALDLGPPRLARGLAEHRARVPMLRQLGVS